MSTAQQDPMKRLINELDLDCGNADAVAEAIDALIQARIKEAMATPRPLPAEEIDY